MLRFPRTVLGAPRTIGSLTWSGPALRGVAAPTLLIAGAVSILTGGAFAYVARAVTRRPTSEENQPARRAHGAWWLGLGSYLVIQGALTVAAGLDALSVGAYYLSRIVTIPLLCAAVWGITSYLAFLYTGNRAVVAWIGFAYVVVAAVFYYATYSVEPALRIRSWVVELDDSGPLYRALYVVIGAPPILASIAYLSLLRRLKEPAQRRRVILVAGSILGYVGGGLAARLAASDVVIFVTLVGFGVAAAAMSLAAYRSAEVPA